MTEVSAVNPEEVGIKTITIAKKRHNLFMATLYFIGRLTLGIAGVFGLLCSIALMITIIGIIPGLMMFAGSMFFIGIAFLNLQEVKCPHCNKKSAINKRAEDFECKRCKRVTIVNWE